MTVVFKGIRIDRESVRKASEGVTVFSAASVAYRMGLGSVDSGHRAYRPVLRILNEMHREGEISKAYFSNNVSVFYRRCVSLDEGEI